MHYDELFPGRFIKSGEFQGKKVTLTLTAIRMEELPQEKGPDKPKPILSFKETKKEWALNVTNGQCLRALFGTETNDWIGKRVILFPAPYEGETAVRVWGSPELKADTVIEVKLPRKKPFKMTMHATTTGATAREPGED